MHGVKIAVVGVSDEAGWTVEPGQGGVQVRRADTGDRALARMMPVIRKEQPDVWVLLADASDRQLRRWMKTFPEFDAGLALRSTSPLEESRVGSRLLVAPDRSGRWMAECRLVFDTVQKRVVRSGGHLVDLHRLPVSQRAPVLASREGKSLDRQRSDEGLDLLWEPAYPTGVRWGARLTRTELRDVVARWKKSADVGSPAVSGLDQKAWAQGELRLPSGQALHATKRYRVAMDEALLVPLGGSGERIELAVLREPRARWSRLDSNDSPAVHR